ncbi:hypothetical protein EJ06DRAFT_251103 [Trichodelitschia bisporula]|uniref:Uncharacterized protein n=1 Tax=Trichodelitschia bisporula TaxID=703511 RepID=A0A6G1HJ73_9PEZI|nr:hypothetical protein EJ06DRAFT_251103 [Trichodelitschia bisporula]
MIYSPPNSAVFLSWKDAPVRVEERHEPCQPRRRTTSKLRGRLEVSAIRPINRRYVDRKPPPSDRYLLHHRRPVGAFGMNYYYPPPPVALASVPCAGRRTGELSRAAFPESRIESSFLRCRRTVSKCRPRAKARQADSRCYQFTFFFSANPLRRQRATLAIATAVQENWRHDEHQYHDYWHRLSITNRHKQHGDTQRSAPSKCRLQKLPCNLQSALPHPLVCFDACCQVPSQSLRVRRPHQEPCPPLLRTGSRDKEAAGGGDVAGKLAAAAGKQQPATATAATTKATINDHHQATHQPRRCFGVLLFVLVQIPYVLARFYIKASEMIFCLTRFVPTNCVTSTNPSPPAPSVPRPVANFLLEAQAAESLSS